MCHNYLQSHFYMSMLKVVHPVALILGAVSVQKCTLAVAAGSVAAATRCRSFRMHL